MIEARDFIEAAQRAGFAWYAGVPCSFFRPFIDYIIDAPELNYVGAANEGDAVAAMAGTALAGRPGVALMQNSGLGNAVSPLTSLAWVFRLPMLLVVTWRGEPGASDEPQHELMGQVTHALLEQMDIPWETFPDRADAIEGAIERARAHMGRTGRPYALVMRKGTVAPFAGSGRAPQARPWSDRVWRSLTEAGPEYRPTRAEALERIIALTPLEGTVVIATTGYTSRELYALDDRANQLYMVGSMGCASSLALGLSLARPELRVVVVDGDGAALMRLGNLATLGAYAGANLVHLVLDNGMHESTGGQATVSPGLSFARIAESCGYALALEGGCLELLDRLLGSSADPANGPRLGHLRIRPGTAGDLPRPTMTPREVGARLVTHIGAAPALNRGEP